MMIMIVIMMMIMTRWGGLIVLLQTSPESPDIFRSVENTKPHLVMVLSNFKQFAETNEAHFYDPRTIRIWNLDQ